MPSSMALRGLTPRLGLHGHGQLGMCRRAEALHAFVQALAAPLN